MTAQGRTSGIPAQELFESHPLPMFVYDLETLAFLSVNDATVRQYGYSRRELLAMTIKEIRPPEDIPLLLEQVAMTVEGPAASGPWRHRRKDGTVFEVEIVTHTFRLAGRRVKIVMANDITERRRMEGMLLRAAEEWRLTFDAMNDAVAWVAADGRILRCNRAMALLVKREFSDIVGRFCWEIVHGTSARVPGCPIGEVLRTRRRAVSTLEQGERTFRVVADPFFDKSGQLVGITHIMSDVTREQRAERALHDITFQQRALLDNIPDIAWLKDEQSRFLAVNEAFAQACGVAAADLAGKTDLDIWPRELAVRYRADDAEVMRSRGRKVVEEPLVDKAGQTTWIETIKTPIVDDQGRTAGTAGIARDVTERVRAREALRRKDHILSEAQRIAHIGSWEADFRTGRVSWSEETHRIYGTSPETFVPTLASFLPLIHPGDRKALAGWIRAAGAGQRLENLELRAVRPDGTERWVRGSVEPVLDSAGKPIGAIGTGQDVTESRRFADTLRASEKKFRALFETADDGIFILDMQGRVLDLNKVAHERLGYTKAELLLRSVAELDSPEFAPRIPERIALIRKHGRAVFESAHLRKDGTAMPVEVSAVVIDEDGRKVLYSIVRDISARKRAAADLMEQKAFTERLIQGSSIATFVLNHRHEVILWNKACEELTGVAAAAMLGTTEAWRAFYDHPRPVLADLVLDGKRERAPELYAQASPSVLHPEGLHAERWIMRLHGKDRYVVFDAAPVRDVSGKIVAAIETLEDFTAKKRAEEAVAESEERYRDLFENAEDMIQSVAPDGRLLYVNPAWRRVLGYAEADLDALNVFDVVHPDCSAACTAIFASAMAGRPTKILEAKLVAKNGTAVDVEGSANPRAVDGKVVSVQCFFRNVSERRGLQDQLRQISQDWEETFDTLTDMVTVHDRDFNIIRANKAAEKILGLPFLAVKPVKCFEYYHGTGCPPAGCPSCNSLTTGKPSVNEMYEPHLGRHIEIRAIPRLDGAGQVVGLIHVVRDITEHRKAEEAATRYTRELAALNEASNTLILTTSIGDIYREICSVACSVFELKMCWLGVVDQRDREIRPVAHAGDEAGYLKAIRVAWDDSPAGTGPTGTAVKTKRAVNSNVDDPRFAPWRAEAQQRGFASSVAVPLLQSRGECTAVLNLYSDDPDFFTTDRMRLCQIYANLASTAIENVRLIEGLEEKVFARTLEIESANAELQRLNAELELRRQEAEAASRTKSAFLANMSHELRTPLNAIIGFSDLMVRGMAGPLAANHQEYLGDILTGGRHLLSLINDILDLSKVEAGKMALESAEYDLADLVGRSLVFFREKAAKHGLRISTQIEAGIGPAFGDERKIRQVIYNLLSNAVKFTPDGGAVEVRVRTMAEQGVPFVEVAVSDTGNGIAHHCCPRQDRLDHETGVVLGKL